jgi:hypothetical protein
MFLKKPALALLALPCLFFASSSFAATAIGEKYAPYIGFEHGFSRLTSNNKTELKYTPRFFLGFSPIQTKKSKFGLEVGYTVPATSKDVYGNRYNYYTNTYYHGHEIVLKIKSSDLYLTFDQQLSKHIHWFLKPGAEYVQKSEGYNYYESYGKHNGFKFNETSVYLSAQAGIGYNFNNGLGINFVSHCRMADLNHHDDDIKRFMFTMNAQYSF